MEKKNAFTITRARPEDAAALLDYLKIVGGETDNLSFGAEGVPLAPEEEQAYLRTQVDSPDHVQYLARVDGELIGHGQPEPASPAGCATAACSASA